MRPAVLALVAALALAPGVLAQANLSNYVALGDSLTAGFASGGLAQAYQKDSFPAILARQFGVASFQQPIISDPGIPAVYELMRLDVVNGSIVPTIAAKAGQGQPINATYEGIYNNLGIPGAKVGDLLTKTGDIQHLDPANIMYDLVLRFPVIPGTTTPGTALYQGIGAAGTFYTVYAGNNDILAAVVAGVALDGVTLTPKATFQEQYTTLLGGLRQAVPNAAIVVGNIGDVLGLPFVTAVKPYIFTAQGQKVYLLGEAGPLTDADYVTLGASQLIGLGYGIPGTGRLLPEGGLDSQGNFQAGVILRASEIAAIKARTAELNGVIAAVASQVGAKLWDVNAFFEGLKAHGYVVGGIWITPAFLTGGFFSYDGIHPQNLGAAIAANDLIAFINAQFGTAVPAVNLSSYLGLAASATSVQAAQTVFGVEAYEQLLALMAPEFRTDLFHEGTPGRMRVRVSPPGSTVLPGIVTP